MVHLVKKVNYNSEWDSSDLHRITPFLAKAQFVLGHSDVTLVTQCSFQNLFLLPKLIDTWQVSTCKYKNAVDDGGSWINNMSDVGASRSDEPRGGFGGKPGLFWAMWSSLYGYYCTPCYPKETSRITKS